MSLFSYKYKRSLPVTQEIAEFRAKHDVTEMNDHDTAQYFIFALATRGKRFYNACDIRQTEQVVWGGFGTMLPHTSDQHPPFIPKHTIFAKFKNTARLHDIVRGRDRQIKMVQFPGWGEWRACIEENASAYAHSPDIIRIKQADSFNLLD